MSENNRKLPLWMVKSDDHHRSDTTSTRDELSAPEEQVVIPETDDDGSPYSSVSSVAEQQTVPYTNLPREKADDRVKPSCDAPDSSPKPDVDDEALELVREIFFT
ncbi:hypothetical protein DNTS_001786 [Danionella cerebrum]|uniref:Uncharacterized protein n=1 Tax=Danionella cerebrum TaxID=2873325 RepID=A0A553MNR3_9TELE|nr:hypothetical protein DNTS_001786 [Danionella translucida]